MKIRKVLSTIGLISVLSLSILPTVSNAENVDAFKNASTTGETTLTEKDFQKVKSNLLDMGIDSVTVDNLIVKLENGGVIDSDIMSPEQAIDTNEVVEGGLTTTTYIYPDGSQSQLTVEDNSIVKDNSKITLFSITDGSCTSGSGYVTCKNRKIAYTGATYGFSFIANYETASGAYDQITSADKWNIWTAGGTYANPKLRIVQAKENANGKAEARLSGTITLANSAGAISRSLSLLVGKDAATDKWNAFY
ncbi:hypothetical protein ABEV54_07060 [Peribacillus psychrosaccharolyticus]|uniref:hypothetical protein n=1 Tax=Peribacillus psychrosaccharolyticus TaxID=1407 RepID=UPI003D2BDDAB